MFNLNVLIVAQTHRKYFKQKEAIVILVHIMISDKLEPVVTTGKIFQFIITYYFIQFIITF